MIGIYFSGTGNTKHCITKFIEVLHLCDTESDPRTTPVISIEDSVPAADALKNEPDLVVLAYPIYYSNLPKIMRDFIVEHEELWYGKKIFIICTMALFSGDGTGVSARLLTRYGAHIIGGVHVIMPDSISDVKLLKYSPGKNRKIISKTDRKLEDAARNLANHTPPREGLSFFAHLLGLFGQRLWFSRKTIRYCDKLSSPDTESQPSANVRCATAVSVSVRRKRLHCWGRSVNAPFHDRSSRFLTCHIKRM